MKRAVALACVTLLAGACGKAGAQAAPVASAEPATVEAGPAAAAPGAPLTLEARAAKLHREAIVVDTHDDVTSAILEDGFDLGTPDGKTATDLPKMRAGGIGAEFFSIYVDPRFYLHPTAPGGGPARRALDMIDATYQQIERHSQDLVFAGSVDDIRRAKRDGKIAILMGIEGGYAIEDSLGALHDFYRLGVRYMGLVHSVTGDWADSAGVGAKAPDPKFHGLTPFGEDVVREMERIGMLVDVSHASDETLEDVLRVAKAPILASHSSARALCDSPRNQSDDQLRAIAANGGVVMVNFYAAYIDPKFRDAARAVYREHAAELAAVEKDATHTAKMNETYRKLEEGIPRPPVGVLVDHIEHIAKVAGDDHVGLGSDFDGVSALPVGLEGIDGLPRITEELLRRGWSDEDVKKVLGENFLRVLSAAEAYAHAAH
ncbi:MAG TPA: dipeptidase [Polyangiaceae bacterium]